MALIFASYNTLNEADRAFDALQDDGIQPSQVGVISSEDSYAKEKGATKGVGDVVGSTASGAVQGAAVGGLIALLAGVAAIALPGLGGLIVTGPLASSLGLSGLAGSTATGAIAGAAGGGVIGLVASLVNLGVSEADARDMEDTVKGGGALISVDTEQVGVNQEDVIRALQSTNPRQLTII